jgi:exonuclease SbcD
VLSLSFEPAGGGELGLPSAPTGRLDDHDVAVAFVRDVRGRPVDAAESALLQDACDACCDDVDLDAGIVA